MTPATGYLRAAAAVLGAAGLAALVLRARGGTGRGFPADLAHAGLYLAAALLAAAAGRAAGPEAAGRAARALGLLFLALALLGFFFPWGFGPGEPASRALPLGGGQIALHALIGLAGLAWGWAPALPGEGAGRGSRIKG